MVPYFDSQTEPSLEIFELKMQETLVVLLQLDERFYPCLFDFSQPWKIDIEEFINENYMYDLSLDEIARFTGKSLVYQKEVSCSLFCHNLHINQHNHNIYIEGYMNL